MDDTNSKHKNIVRSAFPIGRRSTPILKSTPSMLKGFQIWPRNLKIYLRAKNDITMAKVTRRVRTKLTGKGSVILGKTGTIAHHLVSANHLDHKFCSKLIAVGCENTRSVQKIRWILKFHSFSNIVFFLFVRGIKVRSLLRVLAIFCCRKNGAMNMHQILCKKWN